MYGPNELVASVSGQSSHTRSNSECQPHHSWLRCGVVNGQPLDWSWTMASLRTCTFDDCSQHLRLLNDIIANCGSGHKLNPRGCLLSLRKVFVILSCEPTKNRTTGDLKETSGKLPILWRFPRSWIRRTSCYETPKVMRMGSHEGGDLSKVESYDVFLDYRLFFLVTCCSFES